MKCFIEQLCIDLCGLKRNQKWTILIQVKIVNKGEPLIPRIITWVTDLGKIV